MLKEIPGILVVGEAHSSDTFVEALEKLKPDLVFLDIMLKHVNSLDILMDLSHTTQYIITTAYPQHALRGYECNVIDYLMKPVSEERLRKAVEKAIVQHHSQKPVNESVFLKADGKFYKFELDEILFIKGMENYVVVHTEMQKLVCKTTMSSMINMLPSNRFLQVHRSYIVNTNVVSVVEKLNLMIKDHVIPISRERKQTVYQRLFNGQLPVFFD
jgi:DNA-binding LytR/AlgR family response regulator